MSQLEADIGRAFRSRPRGPVCLALASVAADLGLVWLDRYPESLDGRWAVALVALVVLAWRAGGDLPTLGLCGPAGGWRRWVRLGAGLGLVAVACFAVAAGVLLAAGVRRPVPAVGPGERLPAFLRMCVFAPLLEEALYRVVLCAPLAAVGPWRSIGTSGVVFALLHVVYGNPSPENVLGGFFLGWAYLRSGSVLVPVALHAAGNLLALTGQVAYWQWATTQLIPG